jgi:hypothetical protein
MAVSGAEEGGLHICPSGEKMESSSNWVMLLSRGKAPFAGAFVKSLGSGILSFRETGGWDLF